MLKSSKLSKSHVIFEHKQNYQSNKISKEIMDIQENIEVDVSLISEKPAGAPVEVGDQPNLVRSFNKSIFVF